MSSNLIFMFPWFGAPWKPMLFNFEHIPHLFLVSSVKYLVDTSLLKLKLEPQNLRNPIYHYFKVVCLFFCLFVCLFVVVFLINQCFIIGKGAEFSKYIRN